MSVWVDIGSEQLTFLRWTPGIASLLKQPSPDGVGFLTWVGQEHRQDFLAWLQAMPTENTAASRNITLRLPRTGHNPRGRDRLQTRHFTCSVFRDVEDLPETSNPSEANVVRLDLHEYKKRPRPKSRGPSSGSKDQLNTLLWVEERTKRILKSEHAPGLMFQVGSCLVDWATQDACDPAKLFWRINSEIMKQEVFDEMEPLGLGTFTLASGGYQLLAEVTMVAWGDYLEGTETRWVLLSLSKARLLGQDGSKRNAQGQKKMGL